MKKTILGQSLIEVLMGLVIMTLVLTAIVSGIISAIRAADVSQKRARATFLSQEGLEWLRGQRQIIGWTGLANMSGVNGISYCINDLPTNIVTLLPGDCGSNLLADIYKRELVLTVDQGNSAVKALVSVGWSGQTGGGSVPLSAKVTTDFYYWEAQAGRTNGSPPPEGSAASSCDAYCKGKFLPKGWCFKRFRGNDAFCSLPVVTGQGSGKFYHFFSGGDNFCPVLVTQGVSSSTYCCCKSP